MNLHRPCRTYVEFLRSFLTSSIFSPADNESDESIFSSNICFSTFILFNENFICSITSFFINDVFGFCPSRLLIFCCPHRCHQSWMHLFLQYLSSIRPLHIFHTLLSFTNSADASALLHQRTKPTYNIITWMNYD